MAGTIVEADTSESSDHVVMASALHPNRWMVSERVVSGRVLSVLAESHWITHSQRDRAKEEAEAGWTLDDLEPPSVDSGVLPAVFMFEAGSCCDDCRTSQQGRLRHAGTATSAVIFCRTMGG